MSTLRIGELFAGYGGLGMGVTDVLGGDVAWVSEIDPGACKILAHRFPDVPNHGDITAIDWAQVEPVDVLTGGFPCQDLSLAGLRKGLRPDTRSGLWTQFAYAISQLRPGLVVIENVRGLLSATAHSELEPCPWCVGDDSGGPLRALGAVLGDLADLGYDASWQGLRAADVGAPHGRFRVFVIAWPAAHAERSRRDGWTGTPGQSWRLQPADGGGTAPYPQGHGRDEGGPEPAGFVGGSDDAVGGAHPDANTASGSGSHESRGRATAGLDVRSVAGASSGDRARHPAAGVHLVGRASAELAWGPYFAAVHRWERVLGRVAPSPTELSAKGAPRLSPAFVEWLMGLPAGWVTDVPGLSRNEQLKALGNGVVPQQAARALRLLLPDVAAVAA